MTAGSFNTQTAPFQQPEFYTTVRTKRLLAWVVDVVVTLIITLLICVLTLGIGFFLIWGVHLFVNLFYRWSSLRKHSATLGMRLMAIQLRDAAGYRLDSGTAFAHTAGYLISVNIGIAQMASIIMMLTSARRQGLSDMVLGTTMINNPRFG